jgi:hypothetical protein
VPEEMTISMVEKEIPFTDNGFMIEAPKMKIQVPVLTVTRTQETTETYTLEQVRNTIANIEKELANAQARLDYQYQLKEQLESVK